AVHVPLLELAFRGTLVYWLLFGVFRFVLRRDVGAVGVADLIVLVIIADAAQNAMSGGYTTVAEGAILIATLVFWNWFLDYLAYHFAWARRLTEPPRVTLIRDGILQRRNLRREFITTDELEEKLREQGLDGPEKVRRAYLESDGQISVIRADRGAGRPAKE